MATPCKEVIFEPGIARPGERRVVMAALFPPSKADRLFQHANRTSKELEYE